MFYIVGDIEKGSMVAINTDNIAWIRTNMLSGELYIDITFIGPDKDHTICLAGADAREFIAHLAIEAEYRR